MSSGQKTPLVTYNYDIIATTGKFDPLWPRDILFLEYARSLGDELVVILLNDYTVGDRQGYTSNKEHIRIARLEALDCVDVVILSQHGEEFRYAPFTEYERDDLSVGYELEQLKPHKFLTPDKNHIHDNATACKTLGIASHYVTIGVYEYYGRTKANNTEPNAPDR